MIATAHRSALAALLALAAVLALAAGCADHSLARRDPDASRVEGGAMPLGTPYQDDILFVIDDSSSMTAEQAALASDAPHLMDALSDLGGGLPDVHIGVVTADLGDGGAGLPGCTATGDGGRMRGTACPALGGAPFLADARAADGTRLRNYTGSLADAFTCMADVGAGGCAIAQPLEAMRRALDPGLGLAPGFLRDDAELLVVIVSDEDDCSVRDPAIFDTPGSPAARAFACTAEGLACAEPDLRAPGVKHDCGPRTAPPHLYGVVDYVAFVRGLKYEPTPAAVSVAIGDDAPVVVGADPVDGAPALLPSCSSDVGSATPALRTAAFTRAFAPHGSARSLCDPGLTDLLAPLAHFDPPIGDPCFHAAVADADPDSPGLQPTCAVTLTERAGTARATVTEVPACDDAPDAQPCWRAVEDLAQCPMTPTQNRMGLSWGPVVVPPQSWLAWQCLVE